VQRRTLNAEIFEFMNLSRTLAGCVTNRSHAGTERNGNHTTCVIFPFFSDINLEMSSFYARLCFKYDIVQKLMKFERKILRKI
jgi:hypothetical protein